MALPFAFLIVGVSEQALGGIPLVFEIVVEDKPFELSCECLFCSTLYYRPYYRCPSCGNEMAKHKRHIIHGSSAIYINMQQIDPSLLGDDDGIYTWLACKHCAQVCMQTCYMCVLCV